jgi:hypothetical protein
MEKAQSFRNKRPCPGQGDYPQDSVTETIFTRQEEVDMGVITASRAAMRVDNTDQADQSRSSALAQITMYIPSDVVATYVALQGIFAPGTNHLKWTLFGIGVGLCILLPILNYFTAKNIGGGAGAANAVGGAAGAAGAGAGAAGGGSGRAGGQVTKQAIVIALAVVAFTTYAMALSQQRVREPFQYG